MNPVLSVPPESPGEVDELKLLQANALQYVALRSRKLAPLARIEMPGLAVLLNLSLIGLAIFGAIALGGILKIGAGVGIGVSGVLVPVTAGRLRAVIGQSRLYNEEIRSLLRLNENYLEALKAADPEKAEFVASAYRQWRAEFPDLQQRTEDGKGS